jgi:hypothetical protein
LLLTDHNSSRLKILSATQHAVAGFDFRKGNITNLEPRFHIFSLTNDKNNTWTDIENDGIVWNVPDQLFVETFTKVNDEQIQGFFHSFESWIDIYMHRSLFSFGIVAYTPWGIFTLGGSDESEVQKVRKRMSTKDHVMGRNEYLRTTFKTSLIDMKLNPSFIMDRDKLPKSITSAADAQYLFDFLTTYGTHYMRSAEFGGQLHINQAMDRSLFTKYESDVVMDKMNAYAGWNGFTISHGEWEKKEDIHVDQEFMSQVQVELFFKGGFTQYHHIENIAEWYSTITQRSSTY